MTQTHDALSVPTQSSSLSEWLNYMQHIHISAIDMGLSRVLPVAEHLGIVQSAKDDAYVFTVAGTNGKGSTTAVIAEICQQAGYKTALYQSPHLIDFNERVRINGQPVGDQVLVEAFWAVEQARLACELTLSFFEMTTLAAMLIFAQADCDVWVLEVGLGGRLDVVNIVDPDLAVITNIGIDHVDWLGDTREKIGFEKAGILRANGLLIYGESDMPQSVKDRINQLNVSCYQAGRDFAHSSIQPANKDHSGGVSQWQYSSGAVTLQLPKPPLSLTNTANAISAVLASPLKVTSIDIATALRQVHLPGRFDQRTLSERHWLFDVAHNAEGIDFLLPQLLPVWQTHSQRYPQARLHLLFSMLGDKPIQAVIDKLMQSGLPIEQWHVAPIDHPRAAEMKALTHCLTSAINGATSQSPGVINYDSLAQATEGVISATTADDLIVVCGSFHTIAETLIALKAVALPY